MTFHVIAAVFTRLSSPVAGSNVILSLFVFYLYPVLHHLREFLISDGSDLHLQGFAIPSHALEVKDRISLFKFPQNFPVPLFIVNFGYAIGDIRFSFCT